MTHMSNTVSEHNLVSGHFAFPQPGERPTSLTLESAAKMFLGWLEGTPDLGAATKRAYRTDVRQFVQAMAPLGPVLVTDLDERHVEIWKASMAELEPTTIRRKLVALSVFFDWARMQRIVTVNPIDFVRKPRKRRKVRATVPLEDYELLLTACHTASERAILGCLFWAGCRRQEVIDLDTGALDLERGTLFVKGKGQNERLLPIPRALCSLMADHLRHRPPAAADEPLFLNRNGRRISTKYLNGWFRGICRRAGMLSQGYTPHACRRGISALMHAQGFPTFAVQAYMGHEDPKTTAGYVQATAQSLRDGMDSSGIFGEKEVASAGVSAEVMALRETVVDLKAIVSQLLGRLSPICEEGVHPLHEALQLPDGVRDDRQTVAHQEPAQ